MEKAGGRIAIVVTHPATRAQNAVLDALEAAGIDATRDAGKFYPQPVGTLVRLPELVRRGQAFRTYTVSVMVVSGDPLNSELAVDRLYALADTIAGVLEINAYRVSTWRGGTNAEGLPALDLEATVTVTEEEE